MLFTRLFPFLLLFTVFFCSLLICFLCILTSFIFSFSLKSLMFSSPNIFIIISSFPWEGKLLKDSIKSDLSNTVYIFFNIIITLFLIDISLSKYKLIIFLRDFDMILLSIFLFSYIFKRISIILFFNLLFLYFIKCTNIIYVLLSPIKLYNWKIKSLALAANKLLEFINLSHNIFSNMLISISLKICFSFI